MDASMTQVLAAPVGRDTPRDQASTTSTGSVLRCTLWPSPEMLPRIRAIVRTHLALWRREELAETACVGVSELLTNVMQHVGGNQMATLFVHCLPEGIQVSVADSDAKLPKVQSPDPLQENGRGLLLLTGEAKEWGVEPTPNGKIVWFLLVRGKQ